MMCVVGAFDERVHVASKGPRITLKKMQGEGRNT